MASTITPPGVSALKLRWTRSIDLLVGQVFHKVGAEDAVDAGGCERAKIMEDVVLHNGQIVLLRCDQRLVVGVDAGDADVLVHEQLDEITVAAAEVNDGVALRKVGQVEFLDRALRVRAHAHVAQEVEVQTGQIARRCLRCRLYRAWSAHGFDLGAVGLRFDACLPLPVSVQRDHAVPGSLVAGIDLEGVGAVVEVERFGVGCR